jgi:hypothetical protein
VKLRHRGRDLTSGHFEDPQAEERILGQYDLVAGAIRISLKM